MRIPRNPDTPVQPAPRPSEAGPDNGTIDHFGNVPWSGEDPAAALAEFLPLFERRPIRDNQGGMRSVGLFNVWFLLKHLKPASVVESGIWKGQSTWLIEQTVPAADILSIDINLPIRQYISPKARYSGMDFLQLDFGKLGWRSEGGLAFFDDHQDVYPRLLKCQSLGIKHIILDDNYPEFAGARHVSAAAILNDRNGPGEPRYPAERRYLMENLEAYHVCRPIFDYREPLTMEKSFLTGPSLLGEFDPVRHAPFEAYHRDMPEYRWTTYLRLK